MCDDIVIVVVGSGDPTRARVVDDIVIVVVGSGDPT
jgi:hypothetical protein